MRFFTPFGMGEVSGIAMLFHFRINRSRFIAATAPATGSLIAYKVLTAFFLESAFLGVLLFGRKLVPQWCMSVHRIRGTGNVDLVHGLNLLNHPPTTVAAMEGSRDACALPTCRGSRTRSRACVYRFPTAALRSGRAINILLCRWCLSRPYHGRHSARNAARRRA